MKKLFPFVFVLFSISTQAQNWQNVCSPGTTFFADTVSTMGAFRLDSTHALPGQTIFYSYHTILDSSNIVWWGCFDTSQGSYLGRKVILTSNGNYYFFNRKDDTIFLNSLATTGNSWKFCDLDEGGYITATVSGIMTEIVLGQSDPVKTISLQAKNSGGADIFHPVNQFVVKLSQNYGLVSFFDVYNFPDRIVPVILKGKSEPALGLQDFTWRDVYDFEIGDEFHYQGYENGTYSKTIMQVIGKTAYGTDSVEYIYKRCSRSDDGSPPTTISLIDTVLEVYNFLGTYPENTILALPEELKRLDCGGGPCTAAYHRYCDKFNGRQVEMIFSNYSYFVDNCWRFPLYEIYEDDYAPGLGRTGYRTQESFTTIYNMLVYFSKGNETWGNPVAENCDILTGTEELEQAKFSVYPNPATDKVTVSIENFKGNSVDFSLYDMMGKLVRNIQINSSETIINTRDFSRGIYLWKTSGQEGKIILN